MNSIWRKLGGQVADSWRAAGLSGSPLLADLGPQDRSWWRFILGAVAGSVGGVLAALVVVVVVAIPAVIVLILEGIDPHAITTFLTKAQDANFKPTFWEAIGLIWTLAISNGALMLTLVWIGSLLTRKPLKLSFTTASRWRWRQLFGCLIFYGLALGAAEAIDVVVFGDKASLPLFSISSSPLTMVLFVVLAGAGLILAAGAEELVFRGWLLRQSAALTRWTWLFILLNGLVFSLAHWDFDPNSFLERAAMGWGFSYMALRMGGIEFSTGAHAANNLLIVLFVEPLTLATPPPKAFDIGSLGDTAMMLVLLIAVTEVVLRVPAIRRLIGPEPVELAAITSP